ncbi:MAG: 2,3-bisphosphoglycerate-independent phosphoglycerate mutase [Alphaproteobacteria bacterium]
MNVTIKQHPPAILCILDGFGVRNEAADNAIKGAKTPFWDDLCKNNPMGLLDASEHHVGLPDGQMGNSEVGHMTIGAGRILLQDLPRISKAFGDGEIQENPIIREAIDCLAKDGKAIHLMGLVSDGGVHSHVAHIIGLVKLFQAHHIKTYIHIWTDGRDTAPRSAKQYLQTLAESCSDAVIATLGGRYYAMDRNENWDRVKKASDAMIFGESDHHASDWQSAVDHAYDSKLDDEFIAPTVIGDYQGIKAGDAILIANYRADRVRQISNLLFNPDFDGCKRRPAPALSANIVMCEYDVKLKPYIKVLFPPFFPKNTLGEVLSNQGMRQLRIAETEKYAHVTYFFNGGIEQVFDNETRHLIASPAVATYDLKPEMSANEVTEFIEESLNQQKFDVIIVNYANPDMVGHTGDYDAAKKAIEAIDNVLSRIVPLVLKQQGTILITADHGNAEMMKDPNTGAPHTAHTIEKVPLLAVGTTPYTHMDNGNLADLAPSLLHVIGIDAPAEMTGRNLLHRD